MLHPSTLVYCHLAQPDLHAAADHVATIPPRWRFAHAKAEGLHLGQALGQHIPRAVRLARVRMQNVSAVKVAVCAVKKLFIERYGHINLAGP